MRQFFDERPMLLASLAALLGWLGMVGVPIAHVAIQLANGK